MARSMTHRDSSAVPAVPNSARKMDYKPRTLQGSPTDMFSQCARASALWSQPWQHIPVYDCTESVEFSIVNAGSDFDIDEPAKPEHPNRLQQCMSWPWNTGKDYTLLYIAKPLQQCNQIINSIYKQFKRLKPWQEKLFLRNWLHSLQWWSP
jgi:hypothetical protein